ncbi:unnamed protein product [Ilex paraguariensis]|uniref:Amidase domain-containing protein n=1 Tax=Ilex paraguariensis TaxID=185542 RepID=A0ABC8R316_9AQUA
MVAKVFGGEGGLDNVDFEGVISVEADVTVAWALYGGSFGVLCRFWGWGCSRWWQIWVDGVSVVMDWGRKRIFGVFVCLYVTRLNQSSFGSIIGENKHHGTTTNPCASDRVPGGSSNGSAVAVGAKLVDFSLGTDTGGSVRFPASFCGIFGFRSSHGVVSTTGVIPMAQSFDIVGEKPSNYKQHILHIIDKTDALNAQLYT